MVNPDECSGMTTATAITIGTNLVALPESSSKTPRQARAGRKLKINTDGFEGYAKLLTAERIRLVQKGKVKIASISALAAALGRDPKSVRRDVLKLERAGVVRTREQINPGHGRVKVVEPVASECQLTAVL